VTIQAGGTVNFTGSGSDPDNNLPLSYLWNFGAGSGVLASTAQNPGPVQFNNLGTFTTNFTVTDSLGLADPTPASAVITVNGSTLSNTSWSLQFVDSEELVGSDGRGVNGFDGNTGTIWHTQWLNGAPPPPHEIQINLGRSANLNGFVYVPRQDRSNGRIGQYEFYVSTDGVNWGSPVATGTFANTATGKQVSFAPKTGQYVRLRGLSEVNGNPWTSMAELNLLGQCIAPAVKLAMPRSLNLQTSTTLNVAANACLDSVTQSGWGVRFVLDGGPAQGGAQVDTHTAPFQAQFANVSLGEHRVEAFIIDNAGAQVAGTATQDQANPVGIGNYFVAMGDSITRGSRDDITSDNTSQDGRNTGGGYEPILNNLRTTAKHYPQTVVNEGVSNATSTDGVSLIPILLSRHPDAQYFLLLYGNSDSSVPVPSGSGLHPGDAGYPGTFKDNMQRIITAVKNAGKQPYLAKNPPAYNSFSARDPLIRAYNQVIDQLVGENNITVVPPDFYTWFQNHQDQLFDGDHPNGVGYQSMANLWQSALP
jgi:lysophospholipase L1-like esterase